MILQQIRHIPGNRSVFDQMAAGTVSSRQVSSVPTEIFHGDSIVEWAVSMEVEY
jgi:hypothetical protein